ncbi:MAG: MBL fold metallo-hydrolase [Ktedonobacteraceae bacterium]
MEFTFLGGASEVGASCTLLQVAGSRVLIDGGMRPAARAGQPRIPDLALLDEQPPQALLITHAHIDHTGALPLIASLYPAIPIYATESTRVLTEILLRDSVRIMEQEGLAPDGETPLYNAEQVDVLLGRIIPVSLGASFAPITEAPDLTVRFLHAGHIMGAAMLFFETPEGTLLHTGDISVTDQRTIKGLDLQRVPQADVMLCEGTYGNRTHSPRKDEERALAQSVQAVIERGGRVLCPAFAVGRSQEIVLILKAFRASGQVSPVPIYLDGMVRSVCDAYQRQSHDLHPNLQRFLKNARRPLFTDPDLHIFSVRAAQRQDLVKRREPMIVISSSGMLTGGASPLYAADLATREQDAILFSGYQDEESPGAALLRAEAGESLRLGEQTVPLICQVSKYNLSGHADAEQIVHAVSRVNPQRLILVHGSPEALQALAHRFPKMQVEIPVVGTTLRWTPRSSPEASSPARVTSPQVEEIAPPIPTITDLWQRALAQGPSRPWTAVELGQQYYGVAYRPTYREQVEQILQDATPYFKYGRMGAQAVYHPRPPHVVEGLRPVSQVQPGEIVLAQGLKGGVPQLALVVAPAEQGTITLLGDQWKRGPRPLTLVQLLPGIRRDDLLALAPEEARQQMQAWRRRLEEEWVDLIAWWDRTRGMPFSYAEVCAHLATDDLRLAWGLEALAHGHELFRREGSTWTPVDEQQVARNVGLVHHLSLVRAGADMPVLVNGRRGTLTGRSTWHYLEVRWEEGEDQGACVRVRGNHVQVVAEGIPDRTE